MSITYDFYHQTPRMWFIGYSSDGRMLTQKEMFEDIMADYANKTVTFEDHPKLNMKQLSIHPCNHAKAMKRIIDTTKVYYQSYHQDIIVQPKILIFLGIGPMLIETFKRQSN